MFKYILLHFSTQYRNLFYNKTKPDIVSNSKTFRFVQLIIALILIRHKHVELWNETLSSCGKNLLNNRDFPLEKRFVDIKYVADIIDFLPEIINLLNNYVVVDNEGYNSLKNEILFFFRQFRSSLDLDDKYRFTTKPKFCPACGYHGLSTYKYSLTTCSTDVQNCIIVCRNQTKEDARWQCKLCETDIFM